MNGSFVHRQAMHLVTTAEQKEVMLHTLQSVRRHKRSLVASQDATSIRPGAAVATSNDAMECDCNPCKHQITWATYVLWMFTTVV
jgi:hypothetical protein